MRSLKITGVGILLLIISFKSFSQNEKINIGFGYNVGTHIKTDGIDFVIDRYNNTRPDLIKQMNKPKYFHGFNYSIELIREKFLIDCEWVGRKSSLYSEIENPIIGITTRDIKFKVNSIHLGIGYKIGRDKKQKGFYAGSDLVFATSKQLTSVQKSFWIIGVTQEGSAKIKSDINIGISPFIYFVGKHFSNKLYLQLLFLDQSYQNLNRTINPNSWALDNPSSSKGKIHSIGISTRFLLFKVKD